MIPSDLLSSSRTADATTTALDQLATFGTEFLDQVSETVGTIVSEFHQQGTDKRTIKPAKGKGYAGGIKYYHEGIFYKV